MFRILKTISVFSEITFNFKNRIITKIKYLQTLAIYIYICLESSRRALYEFRNPIPSLDPKLPKLLTDVRDGSNSCDNFGEQLISIRTS
jgi:hypothetical protein